MGRNIVAALLPLSLVLVLGCQSESYMSSIALTGADSRNDVATTVRKCLERQTIFVAELTEARRMLLEVQGTGGEKPSASYQALRNQVNVCAKGVDAYERAIADVRSRSEALFNTWSLELEQFSSDQMRASSAQRLDQARSGYALLDEEFSAILVQMGGLLDTHRDYVLFFNHNLAGDGTQEMLNEENERFEARMGQLGKDCEVSHGDAGEFIQRLRGAPATTVEGKRSDKPSRVGHSDPER
jgi:hypothetical protein